MNVKLTRRAHRLIMAILMTSAVLFGVFWPYVWVRG